MIKVSRPTTLFSRTARALALAFSIFALFSLAVLQYMLIQPQTRQAADNLAALLVLAAQVWVELPPNVRPDYEKELLNTHRLKVIRTEAAHPIDEDSHLYLNYLEQALEKRIKQPVPVHRHPDHENWLWVDFPMSNHVMRLGFHESHLKSNMLVILTTVIAIGVVISFLLSLLLVRRVAQPLEKIAEATRRIGKGDFSVEIPETGPREIAELAGKINLMEKQIQQLLENRTTLLAGISHDLRTPLARMRLELEMFPDSGDAKLIEGMQNDLTEMDNLIAQTLLLARGGNEKLQADVDINQLIQVITENYQKAGKDVRFASDSECIHSIKADALKRILINLIDNAVTYSDGLAVTVTCECNRSDILIKVIDQGPGIPPEKHKTVFQPFYRLEGSRSKATGGSGLGLAIVHQLCITNDWEIKIISPGKKGTTVQLRLPDTPHRQE